MNSPTYYFGDFKLWYIGPVIAVSGAGVATIVAISRTTHNAHVRDVLHVSLPCCVLAVTAWFCWVVPCLWSRDASAEFLSPPRKALGRFELLICVPAILIGLPVGCLSILAWLFPPDIGSTRRHRLFVAMLMLTALTCFVAPLFIKLVLQRSIRRKAALLHVCYACGYDIRDIPSATCPECGEPIPPEVNALDAQDKMTT